MSNMVGSNPDELDRIGMRLEQASGRIGATGKRLRRSLHSAPWNGGNADRFRAEFDSVHSRAIAEAAKFLDDAYETLHRNAEQQRRASESGPGGLWHRILIGIGRGDGWIRRFGWYRPRLPQFDLPRFPWSGRQWPHPFPFRFPEPWAQIPEWNMPRFPHLEIPDIRPAIPKHWLEDVVIGTGIAGLGSWIAGQVAAGHAGNGDGATPRTGQQMPAPLLPEVPPEAVKDLKPLEIQGPNNFSQAKLVEIAQGQVGQYKNPLGPDGTAWNGQGQCIAWVDRWLNDAGIPGGLPGGKPYFDQLEAIGGVRVDHPLPGDVFQRAIPGSVNGNVHTAIVKSYDAATGHIELIEGNVTPGTVTEGSYSGIKALERPGTEVRFYRLGRV